MILLVEQIVAPVMQERTTQEHDSSVDVSVYAAASRAKTTPASRLPFSDTIQRAFGRLLFPRRPTRASSSIVLHRAGGPPARSPLASPATCGRDAQAASMAGASVIFLVRLRILWSQERLDRRYEEPTLSHRAYEVTQHAGAWRTGSYAHVRSSVL
jgi:hypothetical protein